MKKFLILAVFIISLPAYAENMFLVPDWSEFCPPSYCNLEPNKNYFWAEKKYWVARKKDFDNKKMYCDAQKNREECYKALKEQEFNKNNIYFNQKNIQQQRANSAIMYNSIQGLKH